MATREGSGFLLLAQPALFQHGTPHQCFPLGIPPRVAHSPPYSCLTEPLSPLSVPTEPATTPTEFVCLRSPDFGNWDA